MPRGLPHGSKELVGTILFKTPQGFHRCKATAEIGAECLRYVIGSS
jgi:hypothetical protein